jgi:hypothetical protein
MFEPLRRLSNVAGQVQAAWPRWNGSTRARRARDGAAPTDPSRWPGRHPVSTTCISAMTTRRCCGADFLVARGQDDRARRALGGGQDDGLRAAHAARPIPGSGRSASAARPWARSPGRPARRDRGGQPGQRAVRRDHRHEYRHGRACDARGGGAPRGRAASVLDFAEAMRLGSTPRSARAARAVGRPAAAGHDRARDAEGRADPSVG